MLCQRSPTRSSCVLLASSALFLPPAHPSPPQSLTRPLLHSVEPQTTACGLCDDDHCIRHTLTRTAHCFRFRFAKKRCLIPMVRTRPVAPLALEKDGMIVHHLLVPHFRAPVSRLCLVDQHTSNLSSSRNCNNPRTRRFASAQTFAHAHVSLPTLTWPDLLGPVKWILTDSDSTADAAELSPSGEPSCHFW